MPPLRITVALTVAALVAFAANSLLCRLALAGGAIDPVGFTAVRLGSGAVVLLPWAWRRRSAPTRWRPASAAALVAYAGAFSLAYVTLDAGTGALLLFGFVQLTMFATGWAHGERPNVVQLAGTAAALAGVAWLVSPGVTAPEPLGALLMASAGVAWGVYSLLGRGTPDPAADTARNFLLAAPLGVLASVAFADDLELGARGVALAATSGAVTSGLGYVAWYGALRGHTRASAAVVQLAVPVLAAAGGVAWLGEEPGTRLVGSAALTLGGVAAATLGTGAPRSRPPSARA